MESFQSEAEQLVTSAALGYDQKLRRLAGLAVSALPYPDLSPVCAEALQARVICDMYEGNAPFTPAVRAARLRDRTAQRGPAPRAGAAERPRRRAVVPDHAVQPGALGHHLPGLPRRHRRPARAVRPRALADAELDASCGASGSSSTACCPTPSCTPTSGPATAAWCVRSGGSSGPAPGGAEPDPEGDPAGHPDDLVLDAVRTVFVTGKPHFVNHPMMVDGPRHRLRGGELLQLAEDPRRRPTPWCG